MVVAPPPGTPSGWGAPLPDPNRKGRGLRRAGLILIGLGLASALLLSAYGLLFASRRTDQPVAMTMPGTTTVVLEPGEYGLYSRLEGGGHPVAYDQNVTVNGPTGPVSDKATFGLFSDLSSVESDGATYEIFNRFTVTTAGQHSIEIVKTASDNDEDTILVARYIAAEATAVWVIVGVLLAVPLVFLGLVLFLVGLLVRSGARRQARQAGWVG